jgi:hypothetical protein
MVELIGLTASLIVLTSFLVQGELRIRIINVFGSLLFIIYGIYINALSVWILNGILFIVHIYYIVLLRKTKNEEHKTKR